MDYMIMFVLNDPKQVDLVLDSWDKAGVKGSTLIESTGAYRHRMRIPGRYAFATSTHDENNLTLMAVVSDEVVIKKCLDETEKIIGDLSKPNTGVFTWWPLGGTKGLAKNYEETKQ